MDWFKKSWIVTIVIILGLVSLIWGPKIITKEKPAEAYFGDVETFEINELAIFKKDDMWWVKLGQKELIADRDRVEQMIKQLSEVRLKAIVSDNKERENEMGFGQVGKVEIKVGDKRIEVGGMGGDYSTTLVRIPDEVRVYAVDFLWNKESMSSLDYWKNSKVTNLPLYQISKIKINRNGKEIIWETKDNKWERQEVVAKIASLGAESFLGEKPNDKSIVVYEIETDKEVVKLEVGKMWASADGKYYYQIGKSDFDLLTSSQ